MPYVINNSSGEPVIIQDVELNSEYSINLVGRNYPDYGREFAQNSLQMLEHFANDNPPPRPTGGQLWYDTGGDVLRVYDDRSAFRSWVPLNTLVSATPPGGEFNQKQRDGILYYNTDSDELFINVNNDWVPTFSLRDIATKYGSEAVIGFPTVYGSTFRTIFLEDDAGVPRSVLALTYNNNGSAFTSDGTDVGIPTEKIMAIFSGHADKFTVNGFTDSSETGDEVVSYYAELVQAGGIGIEIVPGMNLRTDAETRVQFANQADSANIAFNINTGNAEVLGTTITASNVYQKNDNLIPNSDDGYTLGQANSVFSEGYITDLYIGNGTTGNILPNGSSVVNIGGPGAEINEIYVTDIYVAGDIVVDANTNIGSPGSPINHIYVEELSANVVNIDGYTMPTSAGDTGQQMFINASNEVFWANSASSISSVLGGLGLTASVSAGTPVGPSGEIQQDIVTIAVGAGNGITANANDIEVDLSVFDTNDLPEGLTNKYFSDALARAAFSGTNGVEYVEGTGVFSADDSYMRGLLSGGTGITYNPSTGEIINSYTSSFDGFNPSDFVNVASAQAVTGEKTFTAPINATGGIQMAGADFTYTGSLVFTGTGGSVTFSSGGDLVASGDLTAFSDARLKTNLEIIPNALDKIDTLTGYVYERVDQDFRKQTGLIAQDVQKVLPEAVTEASDGTLGVAYGNMMGLMVEAIKELRQEVADLKKELGR